MLRLNRQARSSWLGGEPLVQGSRSDQKSDVATPGCRSSEDSAQDGSFAGAAPRNDTARDHEHVTCLPALI